MWFTDTALVDRAVRFDVKRINAKRVSWNDPVLAYGAAVPISPFGLTYAIARTSAIGSTLKLPGKLAALGLAIASLGHLKCSPAPELRVIGDFSLLKDFVATSLKGVIGAAITYHEMQTLGYAWTGHWEDCVATWKGAHPDFVFSSLADVCLVDAKGSMSPQSVVEKLCRQEWSRQIRPQANAILKGGGRPTEGRVVGAVLSDAAKAVMVAAHGHFEPPDPVEAAAAQLSVMRANYANAADLLALDAVATAIRQSPGSGQVRQQLFQWLGELTEVAGVDDEVFLGPRRLVITDAQGRSWAMKVFCRERVMSRAIEVLTLQPYARGPRTPRPVFDARQLFLSTLSQPLEMELESQVTVQSRDGVGAVFTRID